MNSGFNSIKKNESAANIKKVEFQIEKTKPVIETIKSSSKFKKS
jgi:hypothetical protein